MNGEKTANGTNLVINGANGDDTKWQSGSLSQDNRNIYTQDQAEVSLQNITLETKEHKPHRFISLGWCRKKQGFNLFGHCLLLVIFILSLVLIVALMYWMD